MSESSQRISSHSSRRAVSTRLDRPMLMSERRALRTLYFTPSRLSRATRFNRHSMKPVLTSSPEGTAIPSITSSLQVHGLRLRLGRPHQPLSLGQPWLHRPWRAYPVRASPDRPHCTPEGTQPLSGLPDQRL